MKPIGRLILFEAIKDLPCIEYTETLENGVQHIVSSPVMVKNENTPNITLIHFRLPHARDWHLLFNLDILFWSVFHSKYLIKDETAVNENN